MRMMMIMRMMRWGWWCYMAKAMTTIVKILTIMMMMVNNARPSSTLLGKLIKGERGNDETRQWQADLKAFVLQRSWKELSIFPTK